MTLQSWGITVATVGIVCAVAISLGSGEKIYPVVKTVAGICLILVIVSPLLGVYNQLDGLAFKLDDYVGQFAAESNADALVLEETRRSLDASLKTELEQQGYQISSVTTTVNMSEADGIYLERVEIAIPAGWTSRANEIKNAAIELCGYGPQVVVSEEL